MLIEIESQKIVHYLNYLEDKIDFFEKDIPKRIAANRPHGHAENLLSMAKQRIANTVDLMYDCGYLFIKENGIWSFKGEG